MSLENIYTRFLATPREDVLDDNASFHYITTAISINGPDAIIAQLAKENLKALKKRQEKVINSFETGNQLLLEVATEIQFLTSGCNWLPGLDDNFLADMIVRFPVVHIVNFENGRIREVRIYWDQSNILKQLNVIGKSGRNWPIKDGAEQVKMIVGSVSRQSAAAAAAPAPPQQQQQEAPQKQQQQQQQNQGQQSRDQNQGQQNQSQGQNRNQQNQDKDHQLEHGDSRPSPKGRAPYTQNEPFNIGAGGDELPQDRTNTRGPAGQRPANNANSQTYSHFEFDDDNEHAPPAMASRKQTAGQGAHQSTWDYESPEMPVNTRPANTRPAQGGNNNGRPSNVDSALNNARRNEGHSFEFGDSSSPPTDKGAPRAGKGDSNRSGYQWTQQKNAQDDDNGFFGGFGKESTTGGIHIAGNGQGQSKSVTKNWGWDQEAEQVGQRGQQQQQQRGGNQQDQQRGGNQQQQQSNQQQQSGQRGLAQKAKADEEEEKGFWDY